MSVLPVCAHPIIGSIHLPLYPVAHSNNEKHILETVAHPFLVNMWGTFQDDINLYMVMDYVPGGELFSVLRRSQVNWIQLGEFRLSPSPSSTFLEGKKKGGRPKETNAKC